MAEGGRLLVVDDDFGVSRLIRDLLTRFGHEVDIAGTAKECFERISQAPPRLLLLDVMLPDMNGLEVLAKLRGQAATAKLPIIVISTLTDKTYRQKAAGLGADAFLNKPFTPVELLETVKKVLQTA